MNFEGINFIFILKRLNGSEIGCITLVDLKHISCGCLWVSNSCWLYLYIVPKIQAFPWMLVSFESRGYRICCCGFCVRIITSGNRETFIIHSIVIYDNKQGKCISLDIRTGRKILFNETFYCKHCHEYLWMDRLALDQRFVCPISEPK